MAAEQRSQLSAQILMGRVSSVDKSRHTAQVKFPAPDGEEAVTWDLQVLVPVGGDYALPAEDTPVLCLILDGRLGIGFVLGCFYTEGDEAPLDDAGKRSIAGDDLRLGDPEAEKLVVLDEDESDCGCLVVTVGTPPTTATTVAYIPPPGPYPPAPPAINIELKGIIAASAEKVRAK